MHVSESYSWEQLLGFILKRSFSQVVQPYAIIIFFFGVLPYLKSTIRKDSSLLLADLETSDMFSEHGHIKDNIQVTVHCFE